MHSHYLFLALDIAGQRAAEADRYRLAQAARQASTDVNRVRRLVARAAVAVARAADEAAIRQSPTTA